MGFERNQVEEAISRVIKRTPKTELKTKLKRLLETDRKLEEGDNYAFFSTENRAPELKCGSRNTRPLLF